MKKTTNPGVYKLRILDKRWSIFTNFKRLDEKNIIDSRKF